jgi:hypothetical protein
MWTTKRWPKNAKRVGSESTVAEGPDSQLTTTSVCRGRALESAATEMIR